MLTCSAVAGEFVLTGLSNLDGNFRNHELGVCLPHFRLNLTSACKLTITPLNSKGASVSLLQVGEVNGRPNIPRASDAPADVMAAVELQMGYYYLNPVQCPTTYASTIKGEKLLATGNERRKSPRMIAAQTPVALQLGVDSGRSSKQQPQSARSLHAAAASMAWSRKELLIKQGQWKALSKVAGQSKSGPRPGTAVALAKTVRHLHSMLGKAEAAAQKRHLKPPGAVMLEQAMHQNHCVWLAVCLSCRTESSSSSSKACYASI